MQTCIHTNIYSKQPYTANSKHIYSKHIQQTYTANRQATYILVNLEFGIASPEAIFLALVSGVKTCMIINRTPKLWSSESSVRLLATVSSYSFYATPSTDRTGTSN